jgi:protein phosphatase
MEPAMSVITIDLSPRTLVVLVGASGSGKSSFAAQNFKSTQVLSSDHFRAMLCDDASDQSVSHDAFEILYTIARRRLALGHLTVVDATSAERSARSRLIAIARGAHAPVVAIVFDLALDDCLRLDRLRPVRHVPPEVIAEQVARIKAFVASIEQEDFDKTYIVRSRDEANAARITVEGLPIELEGPPGRRN